MYKFNYTKMNRVLDEVNGKLASDDIIENKLDVISGSILFFEDALNRAENLDNKLKVDYENYYYRQLFMLVLTINDLMFIESVGDLLLNKLNKKVGKKKSNPYFNLMVDIQMLIALSFVQNNIIDGAKSYFVKALDFGCKYINESKKNFHDSICCAGSWLGYIYLNQNKCEDALMYYEKTFELYDSVKEEEGFYFKEYNPDDIKLKIEELKKILNK